MTRVRRAGFQERRNQWLRGLTSVAVRQAAQASLASLGISLAVLLSRGCLAGYRRQGFLQTVEGLAS